MNFHLIVINTVQTATTSGVYQTITGMKGVESWWHYIGNMFILKTPLPLFHFTRAIRANHPDLLYFASKLDLEDYGGLLPQSAWDWLRQNYTKKGILKVKPVTKLKASDALRFSTGHSIFTAQQMSKSMDPRVKALTRALKDLDK